MLRTVLFWIHLGCGVVAGAVILVMSATGVALTYETQLLERAERSLGVRAEGAPLPADELLAAGAAWGAARGLASPATSLQIRADPELPAQVRLGREGVVYLDPYNGAALGTGFPRLEAFLGATRGWHRWFNVSGEGRAGARAVTGGANLAFLVLLLTGAVLWFPKRWTWRHIRTVLFFRRTESGRARDFNWHNVLGVWSVLPLVLVVASGVYISYPWAKDLAVWAAGGAQPAPDAQVAHHEAGSEAPAGPVDLDRVMASAADAVPGWRTLLLTVPEEDAGTVEVRANAGFRGESRKAVTLTLDAGSARVVGRVGWAETTRDRKARSFLRFAHTGEFWGVPGQTVAGLVSLAALVLVWTGVSLALRRAARTLRRTGAPSRLADMSAD